MIRAARLRELLAKVPDDAECVAYEGEDTGIIISLGERHWWIRARERGEGDEEDTHTEGFGEARK